MVRSLLLMAALGASTSALAQQAASPAAGAPAEAAPPAAETPAQAVARIVDTEFPAYDTNDDDQLDRSEFGRWMTALKGQEMKATGVGMTPEDLTSWIDGAFKTADTNKSAMVSKAELIAYLTGGTK